MFDSGGTTHHMREIKCEQVYGNGQAEAGDHSQPHEATRLAFSGRGRWRAAETHPRWRAGQ